MEKDKLERTVKPIISPIAYAFEPIWRGDRAVLTLWVEEVGIPLFWGEERVGNTSWCKCGWCTPMPEVHLLSGG